MKTEKELHQEFLKLGANRRKLTNELLALLPEIYDRKIYLKYASTIVEYAGKFGGLSNGVVLKRLRLEKYLSDKPKLRDAIQELSKEVRNKEVEAKNEDFGEGGLFGGLDEVKAGDHTDELGGDREQIASVRAPCKAAPLKITIELSDETAFLFLKLKKKIEKEMNKSFKSSGIGGKFLSNKETMNEILKRLADAEFSEKVVLEDNFCEGKISRYIPVYVKKMAMTSTHGKCAYPNCGHPAEIFHHRERFAESKNHQSIIPLCKIHHEFAHNGIIANESQNIERWNLKIGQINLINPDILYREIRQENIK